MAKKAAEWNPELSSRYRTNRANDTMSSNKPLRKKKKDEPIERKIQNNNIWINTVKDRKEWLNLKKNTPMKCVK